MFKWAFTSRKIVIVFTRVLVRHIYCFVIRLYRRQFTNEYRNLNCYMWFAQLDQWSFICGFIKEKLCSTVECFSPNNVTTCNKRQRKLPMMDQLKGQISRTLKVIAPERMCFAGTLFAQKSLVFYYTLVKMSNICCSCAFSHKNVSEKFANWAISCLLL